MNIRVGLELMARGEKSVADLTAVRLAAVVQTHLKIIFSNLLSLFVLILTNSREEDAVPHLEQ